MNSEAFEGLPKEEVQELYIPNNQLPMHPDAKNHHGWTRVPNELFSPDHFGRFTSTALRVYQYILFKTLNWKKDTDAISYSQFMEDMGIKNRSSISTAIKWLQSEGYIEVRHQPGKQSNLYTIKLQGAPERKENCRARSSRTNRKSITDSLLDAKESGKSGKGSPPDSIITGPDSVPYQSSSDTSDAGWVVQKGYLQKNPSKKESNINLKRERRTPASSQISENDCEDDQDCGISVGLREIAPGYTDRSMKRYIPRIELPSFEEIFKKRCSGESLSAKDLIAWFSHCYEKRHNGIPYMPRQYMVEKIENLLSSTGDGSLIWDAIYHYSNCYKELWKAKTEMDIDLFCHLFNQVLKSMSRSNNWRWQPEYEEHDPNPQYDVITLTGICKY